MSPLDISIHKTLSYFSLFNYPLTKEELFAYLWQPEKINFEEFVLALRNEDEKFGHYFSLPENIEQRRARLVTTEHKMKIARRAARLIRAVPFLRAIFVCNSVGEGIAKEGSDIDFFIITAPKRIWLVRFFTNLILKLFRLRTYGKNSRDKICLSFYVDENNLNLWPLRALDEDVHFVYWLHQMVPLFDPRNLYAKFISANDWTKKFAPNITRKSASKYLSAVKDSSFARVWRKVWETMWQGAYGNFLESQVKSIQTQMFKDVLKNRAKENDNGVVISDTVLKFHENDTRRKIYEEWKEKCTKYENYERCENIFVS
ncbi:MAG: hypothetical protein WC457_00055 [Patescibacteria group bacterium]